MDSIEKAMLGRSQTLIRPPPTPPPTPVMPPPRQEDVIERAIQRTTASTDLAAPENRTVQRTRRSVTLDFERFRAKGLLTPDAQRTRLKEDYRYIKRPVLLNADGKGAMTVTHPNLVMVTSALPGEGKTFTACNLAMSIASERNRTVLLIDADVLKPAVAQTLGFEAELGLVDYLVDDRLQLPDLLVDVNVPSLTILPAGSPYHLSAELLAGTRMRELAAELSARYPDRIVIFDSPPLLMTTEASILASLMGQVLLVVEAGRTPQSQVKDALTQLHADQLVGFVLNKSRAFFGSNRHGYGYGHDGGESAARP